MASLRIGRHVVAGMAFIDSELVPLVCGFRCQYARDVGRVRNLFRAVPTARSISAQNIMSNTWLGSDDIRA